VERELRINARQWKTHWGRLAAAAAGIGFGCWTIMAESVSRTGKPGRASFGVLALTGALVVMGTGARLASQAFAREKREDTLGLLLLTPLRPLEIVLGKLVTTSLPAFYHFVAIIPVLALPVLAGGVTMEDFFLLVVALANLAFLTTTVGLYFSTDHWDDTRAAVTTVVALIILFFLLPPIVAGVGGALCLAILDRSISLFTFSPGYSIWQAAVQRSGGALEIWASLLWVHAVGWFFIRLTCRALPTCCQKKPPVTHETVSDEGGQWIEEAPPLPNEEASRKPRQLWVVNEGSGVRRQFSAVERTRFLSRNAALWLALRWRPSTTRAAVVGSLGLLIAWIVLMTGHMAGFVEPAIVLSICFFANAGFKCHVALQAAQAFLIRNGDDPLQLLLSTPITPRELVEAQVLAIRQPLARKIQIIIACEIAWITLSLALHARHGGWSTFLYLIAGAGMLAMFIPDLYAAGMHGLWRSVVSRNKREAEASSLLVLYLPWCCAFLAMVLGGALLPGPASVLLFVAAWIGTSLSIDRKFKRSAEKSLATEMRLWALRRVTDDLEHYDKWVRAGRALGKWWRNRM
jgi:hypothetical protein